MIILYWNHPDCKELNLSLNKRFENVHYITDEHIIEVCILLSPYITSFNISIRVLQGQTS